MGKLPKKLTVATPPSPKTLLKLTPSFEHHEQGPGHQSQGQQKHCARFHIDGNVQRSAEPQPPDTERRRHERAENPLALQQTEGSAAGGSGRKTASNSWLRWRKCAKLHHQSESIHNDACVFDLAAFKPVNDNTPHPDWASGGGHAKKLRLVRARPLKACHHLVALGNLFLDRPVHVRERSTHPTQDILQTAEARPLARQRNLLHHVIPKELASGLDLTLVQDFRDEVTDNVAVALHKMVARRN
jgi:hypothetical protein